MGSPVSTTVQVITLETALVEVFLIDDVFASQDELCGLFLTSIVTLTVGLFLTFLAVVKIVGILFVYVF